MISTDKKHKIEFGDKIYARLTLATGNVAEMMLDSVSTMTELLSELRYFVRGNRGLCQLYLRNLTQGWSQQRPLMLCGTPTTLSTNSSQYPEQSTFRLRALRLAQ